MTGRAKRTLVDRARGVAPVLGAWAAGRRSSDHVLRERTRLLSGWAKFGLAGLVIGALFLRQDADRREAAAERKEETLARIGRDTAVANERTARDAALSAAFGKLAGAIDALERSVTQERDFCFNLRLELMDAAAKGRVRPMKAPQDPR